MFLRPYVLLRGALIALALLSCTVATAQVEYVVSGIDDPLRTNVLNYVNGVQFGQRSRVTAREADRIIDNAIERTTLALRPYGYYQPDISARLVRNANNSSVVEINVRRGPPMIIRELDFEISGAGSTQAELREWRDNWPLTPGRVLDQAAWEQQKQQGLDEARAQGYLSAQYTAHALRLDLEKNTATLQLHLDTGPRYVFGEVDYGEHVLRPGILEFVPRFRQGEHYSARMVNTFRADLWKTGYFTDVEVRENVQHDASPPTVDLKLTLKTESRSYYQGALGVGTDTGIRLSGQWSRHPMSSRGDRVDIGVGWRESDDEYGVRASYRVPRLSRIRQFWTSDVDLRFENQDLEFKQNDQDEDFIKIANGNIDELHVRLGRLKIRNRRAGDLQQFERVFAQYLRSQRSFAPLESVVGPMGSGGDPAFDRLLRGVDNIWSIGVDLDRVALKGKEFYTTGLRDRAWLFASVGAVAADVDFVQAYLSTRRSYVMGERWKLIVRAELGYSDATVDEVTIDAGGEPLQLSVTRLPNYYRFKAGGSASVRGYAFEQLSNNNVGSNNIATASAEVEFKILESWSIAAFADIGNAFNDFDEPNLKTGVGLGIRWYSIAGPIRVDFARALDFEGKPWRVHFTIGTPLL